MSKKKDVMHTDVKVVIATLVVLLTFIFTIAYFGSYYIVKGMCEIAMKDNPTKNYAGCKEFTSK